MDVWFVTTQYPKYGDHPPYETVSHPAISSHTRPFSMHVPSIYLVWDSNLGVIALRRRARQLAVSRCGFVLAGIYFKINQATVLQIPVALKIMDRAQVLLQRDDVESEIRVMGQLQMGGIEAPLANEYMIRWEYASDIYNQYVATEYVANGSLQAYAHRQVQHLMIKHLHEFAQEHETPPTKLECISYVYRGSGHEWMREGIEIFKGIVRALTYLHAQNVAHLDLDVYNVAVDVRTCPRIIDLGSSLIMDNRGLVGEGYASIKFKPLFVSPELRSHQSMTPPRPGFNGAAADMWSAGVMLVQCVVWGFRGGPTYLMSNTNWRRKVFSHIDATCNPKTCHLCVNFISIPPLIGAIIKQLLHVDPKQRPSAYEVAMALQENRQVQLFPRAPKNTRINNCVQEDRIFAASWNYDVARKRPVEKLPPGQITAINFLEWYLSLCQQTMLVTTGYLRRCKVRQQLCRRSSRRRRRRVLAQDVLLLQDRHREREVLLEE